MSWNPYTGRNRHHPYAGSFPNVYSQDRPAGGTSPAAPTTPPDLANILLWFDVGDPSTLWQDEAGLTPAVDGLPLFRIDNKGSHASVAYIHDAVGGGDPIYLLDEPVLNTGAVGLKVGGNAFAIDVTLLGAVAAPPAGGMSMVGVGRQITSAIGAGTACTWGGSHFVDNDADGQNTAGNWYLQGTNGSAIDTLEAAVDTEWNYCYWAQTGTDIKWRVGGIAEQTAVTNVWVPVGAGQNLGLFGFRAQWAEWIVWTGQLSMANRISLVAYLDGKYGVLPF